MLATIGDTLFNVLVAIGGMSAGTVVLWKPLKWLFKRLIQAPFKEFLDHTLTEKFFTPNGGKSLSDISKKVDGVDGKVTTLTARFEDHINIHQQ